MRWEKRTHWFLWACDLPDCGSRATTHPFLDETEPVGWVIVNPPAHWRGPALAFCREEHRVAYFRAWIAAAMPESLPALTEGER